MLKLLNKYGFLHLKKIVSNLKTECITEHLKRFVVKKCLGYVRENRMKMVNLEIENEEII